MKTIALFILTIFSFQAYAQRIDTLDFVNHLGTIYPVKDKVTLTNAELKQIIMANEYAMKHLKKARLIRAGEIATHTLSVLVLIAALAVEEEDYFWGLLGISAGITGVAYIVYQEPYNKQMLLAIKMYNEGVKAEAALLQR